MTNQRGQSSWHQFKHFPRRLPLRRVLFQIHLWSGMILGLYIFFISVTGSLLVYRTELYRAVMHDPVISSETGAILADEQLQNRVLQQYPGFAIVRFYRPLNSAQAVEIWLEDESDLLKRLFDPHTGEDVGSAVEVGVTMVTTLIRIHEDFLIGPAGRKINGFGAIAVILVLMTGLVIWWQGSNRWKHGLVIHRGAGWRRIIWDLHSMMGFWTAGFVFILSLSGIYLCFPEIFHDLADTIQPVTPENAGRRIVDTILYWLAYLHFGRLNGIGLPCAGPGVCDQTVKAIWAIFGLAPALMFVTGSIVWWQRVLKPWLRRLAS